VRHPYYLNTGDFSKIKASFIKKLFKHDTEQLHKVIFCVLEDAMADSQVKNLDHNSIKLLTPVWPFDDETQ